MSYGWVFAAIGAAYLLSVLFRAWWSERRRPWWREPDRGDYIEVGRKKLR